MDANIVMNNENLHPEMEYINKNEYNTINEDKKKNEEEKKIMKVLFIKGFNTHRNTDNIYFAFDIYTIKNKSITIEYFNYEPSQNINDVYNEMKQQIQTTKYNILVGHSLGGGMLLRFCKENDISLFDKIIFLMPYIYTSPYSLIHILSKMNLLCIEGICLPQGFLSNNCVENNYLFIPLKQICQVYKHVFLTSADIINTLNSSKNIYFVYANDEKVSPIDDNLLDKINDVIYVDGNHTCFCERNNNSIHFFRMLDDLFENKIKKKGKSKNDIDNEYVIINKDLDCDLERDLERELERNLDRNMVFNPNHLKKII